MPEAPHRAGARRRRRPARHLGGAGLPRRGPRRAALRRLLRERADRLGARRRPPVRRVAGAAGRRRGTAGPPRRDRGPRADRVRRRGDRRREHQGRSRSPRRGPPAPTSSRYVGSHPMAGSERSGPLAASAALFDGRPWAVTPHESSTPEAVAVVRALVALCGGVEVSLTPEEHDLAVARTSHLPHLMSSLVAGRLADAPGDHLALSGQGVRDVTRIAAGDPALWKQIVVANADRPCSALLDEVRGELDQLRAAVGRRRPGAADRAARARAWPAPWPSPASTVAAAPDGVGLRRGARPPGRAGPAVRGRRRDRASTSRTSTSTTTPAARSAQVELVVEVERAGHLADALGERGWTSTGRPCGDGGRGHAGR